MNISTRLTVAEDKLMMWALYESAMKPYIEAIWGWDQAWQDADFEKGFASSANYVVEADGVFSGYVQLDEGGDENYLRMLILAPSLRSKKVGALLLGEFLNRSREAGRDMRLRVFRINSGAKRFYEREGWQVASEDEVFFLMRCGDGHVAKIPGARYERKTVHYEFSVRL
ncbi:GNAT family N-acetyltransferase [Undibacterium terreum]|uniref:N-acetyltransferase domain-containing protein n=1 Tax=Undibacterium terreum TaxID=1224302 RepID=A0A916XDS8_9BURK|nr:GNAT family N-acetyltransferase [Undibacterium terreum]GGC64490.1 hypothetical protein GCM10011396_09330 [Undibacterium terreum]